LDRACLLRIRQVFRASGSILKTKIDVKSKYKGIFSKKQLDFVFSPLPSSTIIDG